MAKDAAFCFLYEDNLEYLRANGCELVFFSPLSDKKLPDAYERLLLDVMLGDSTLYSRADAQEASWNFIDPIIKNWVKRRKDGLAFYASGSDPEEIDRLMPHDKKCNCCNEMM